MTSTILSTLRCRLLKGLRCFSLVALLPLGTATCWAAGQESNFIPSITGTQTSAPTAVKPAEEKSIFARYTNAAQDIILKGLELVGINYRWGGNNEDSGLDCSGYVQVVFKDALGLILPRTAKEMSEVGERIDFSALKPGDLVFFNTMRRAFSHVGIYMGDGYFLHAPRKGAQVRLESMEQSYWLQRYNGARRLVE